MKEINYLSETPFRVYCIENDADFTKVKIVFETAYPNK